MKFLTGLWLLLAAAAHAAGLEFKNTLQELHAKSSSTTVTAEFEFTNTGSKPVTIAKSDPGCSCLNVQISGGKLKYAPGESGVIRATFDMGNYSGTVDKPIGVWLDDDPASSPSVKLMVRVHIPVLVSLVPKTLTWGIGAKAEPQTIQITMSGEKPIHVQNITSTSAAFRTELKTVEKGHKYELVVTPVDTAKAGIAVLKIDTDCEVAKQKHQQAFATIRKQPALP